MMFTLIASIGSAVLLWLSITRWYPTPDATLSTAAGAYASVAVTMLGFTLAMLAILVSVADRRLIRNMGRTGHYQRLLKGLYWASAYYAATMLASLVTLFLKAAVMQIGIAVSSGLMIGATICLVVMSSRLWRVLNILVPQDKSPLE
ncbi:hypothetical protein [Gulbenkiania mobilis]|uniref:hypothetical protein n=1 Tax=Gulbenkiania mobilis TaxID=397457 RepID=UPI0006BBF916|nr:hypothetical protein [Gulbenkiania mobilis]